MVADPFGPQVQADVLVAGAGIAGLAAAMVLGRQLPQASIGLLEQAEAFSEVGAGIQLGPNAVRVLYDWGLQEALHQVAAFPLLLLARDARSGSEKGRLRLGERALQRYRTPYATIHRADLHQLLLAQVRAQGIDGHLRQVLTHVELSDRGVRVGTQSGTRSGTQWQAQALVACDGVWSRVHRTLWEQPEAAFSGHLAYRGMVRMSALPSDLRRSEVVAWLGHDMHAVHYPVCAGDWLNVVVVVHGDVPAEAVGWDHVAAADALKQRLGPIARDLHRVLEAVAQWRLWPLFGRPPVRKPGDLVRGPVALMGDAGHPMRPYLAQGAAMALEDAWTLGRLLEQDAALSGGWPALLDRWARLRWKRCGWVQARSQRNGTIFHAAGPLKWGRDAAMAVLGERLMDVPRLYQGPPEPG